MGDHRALTLQSTNMHTLEVKELEPDNQAIELSPDALVVNSITADADNIWPSESPRYVCGSTRMNELFVFDMAEQAMVRKIRPSELRK